jgi:putative flippase GtrA
VRVARLDRLPPAYASVARTFTIYIAFGACAFAADYSVFLLVLSSRLGPYVGNVLGICTGIAVSFSLNRRYNFRKTDLAARRAVRFITVALAGMGVSTLIIMLLAAQSVDVRLAKVAAMLVVFVMQFALNALWTFR